MTTTEQVLLRVLALAKARDDAKREWEQLRIDTQASVEAVRDAYDAWLSAVKAYDAAATPELVAALCEEVLAARTLIDETELVPFRLWIGFDKASAALDAACAKVQS